MIRLALLQTDSSHAEVYQDIATPEAGVHIQHLWGTDQQRTKEIARPNVKVCPNLEEAIVDVDGIMVCGRWGDTHKEVAETALSAGVPVYVDKPFTNSLSDADYLFSIYRKAGVPIFSASPLRFAAEVEAAADQFKDVEIFGGSVAGLGQWPDFGPKGCEAYFYGIHAMELVTALFGLGATVEAVHHGTQVEETVLRFTDGRIVSLYLLMGGNERYEAMLHGKRGTHHISADPMGNFYQRTLERIREFVRNEKPPIDPEETRQNVKVLDAIQSARESRSASSTNAVREFTQITD